MNFTQILEQGGVPGVLLTLYFAIVIDTVQPGLPKVWLGIYSFFAVFLLLFVIATIADHISVFLAWDILQEVDSELADVPEEQFYYTRDDKKETVDKHDEHVYQHQIAIIGGLIAIVTLPIILHLRFGWPTSAASIVTIPLIFYFFVYQQVAGLRNTIMLTQKEYE